MFWALNISATYRVRDVIHFTFRKTFQCQHTWDADVACSGFLSSRIRMNLGNLKLIPLFGSTSPTPALCTGEMDKSAALTSQTYKTIEIGAWSSLSLMVEVACIQWIFRTYLNRFKPDIWHIFRGIRVGKVMFRTLQFILIKEFIMLCQIFIRKARSDLFMRLMNSFVCLHS